MSHTHTHTEPDAASYGHAEYTYNSDSQQQYQHTGHPPAPSPPQRYHSYDEDPSPPSPPHDEADYNPWGRPGCGAPMATGPDTDYRRHAVITGPKSRAQKGENCVCVCVCVCVCAIVYVYLGQCPAKSSLLGNFSRFQIFWFTLNCKEPLSNGPYTLTHLKLDYPS